MSETKGACAGLGSGLDTVKVEEIAFCAEGGL